MPGFHYTEYGQAHKPYIAMAKSFPLRTLVVEHNNRITCPDQFRDDGAADIPGSACYEYFHVFTFLLEIFPRRMKKLAKTSQVP